MSKLYEGTLSLVSGGETLSSGVEELANGGNELADGASTLSENSAKILEGTEQLENGTNELYDGVTKLKEEGLDKLNEEGNKAIDDIDGLMEVKDELVEMAKEYGVYSGLSDNMTGTVKFIMRSDAIKSTKEESKSKDEKETEVSGVKKESKSIFNKIKEWFNLE